MSYYSKYVAVVVLTDPTEVQNKCTALDIGDADKGAIWVNIPELGFSGNELIYCRYGLSIPYIKVHVDDKLWVEPTIGNTKRWIYTGFVDCGNSDAEPDDDSRLIIPLSAGKFNLTFGEDISIVGDGEAKTMDIVCGDASFSIDGDGKTMDIVCGDAEIEIDGEAKTMDIVCGDAEINMTNTKVTVNGNLEVLV